jgi:ABC-type transport system involved in multi-copper enzyme maturation permease subunit
MLRSASGIALGYLVMAFFVFATFSLAYLTLGADRSFQPGTYEVSEIWAFLSILLGLGAAIVGGFLCASVSRTRTAPIVLAALVLVMGIVGAALMPPSDELAPQPRPGNVGNFEAMQNASTPPWIAWLNPFMGAAGVLAGAHLWARSSARPLR